MSEMKVCYLCDNAFTNEELDSDNDLSYFSIGEWSDNYRILFRSGAGRPTAILVETHSKQIGWSAICEYIPRYCPNCGRLLKENGIL